MTRFHTTETRFPGVCGGGAGWGGGVGVGGEVLCNI